MVTDENGNMKFLFANKYYLFGYTPKTVFGQYFTKVVPNDVAWIPMFAEVAFRKRKAWI